MVEKLEALFWLIIFILVGFVWGCLQPFLIPTSTVLVFFGKDKYKQYGFNCWYAKDNLFSAQTGGDPEETVSSRLGKARDKGSGWGYIANKVDLVARVFFNDLDHCNKSKELNEGSEQVTRY